MTAATQATLDGPHMFNPEREGKGNVMRDVYFFFQIAPVYIHVIKQLLYDFVNKTEGGRL